MTSSDNIRNSKIELENIYFWTATINKWQKLLENDAFKTVVIESLSFLSSKKLIDVFSFVIMPNHIHLIWRMNKFNGKELPSASLLKFSAHKFKQMLPRDELRKYWVDRLNKQYEFWQRDSLAIELYTPKVAYQKLDYIHLNPLGEQWNLVTDPCDYEYSSASFYEKGDHNYSFLKHLGEEF
ncbi:MAG: transposase [Bacteroidetes bacterium]|nr:transposase [Bacteroidota bacterium]MDA1121270.1 transposase [Bacteroidota bacterium]